MPEPPKATFSAVARRDWRGDPPACLPVGASDDNPHNTMAAAMRKLHDCSDVLRTIAVASKLLVEQLERIELDIMEFARIAADKPQACA
jgi:hypothetical protein